jgi:hypothetical protein
MLKATRSQDKQKTAAKAAVFFIQVPYKTLILFRTTLQQLYTGHHEQDASCFQ